MDKFDIASEMDRIMNSQESKEMFSNAKMLEKLAFTRVSDEGNVGEIEAELAASLATTAGCCECAEGTKADHCDCHCHPKEHEHAKKEASIKEVVPVISKTASMVGTLLTMSEDLEEEGLEKEAAIALMFANRIVLAAKAKKSKPKSKSKSKSTMKSDEKSKSDKAKAKAKSDKEKEKSKSSKKTAQVIAPEQQRLEPNKVPKGNEADVIMTNMPADLKSQVAALDVPVGLGEVRVKFQGVASQAVIDRITQLVQKLQHTGALQNLRPYKIVAVG